MQEGWSSFLLKVNNQAHVVAELEAESPNAEPVLHGSTSAHRMKPENALTPGQLDNRFLEVQMYQGRPLRPRLSGLGIGIYCGSDLYSRQAERRKAKIGFNVGQGSQDIGFRNTIDILFDIKPAVKVVFDIKDEDNKSTMASLVITDGVGRLSNSESETYFPDDYRLSRAMARHWEEPTNRKPRL